VARTALGLGLLLAAACTDRPKTVAVSGNVEGLDSLGHRADSLLAEVGRTDQVLDSIRVAAREEMERNATIAVTSGSGDGTLATANLARAANAKPEASMNALSSGAIMSQRAQARGDSMARAYAKQFAQASGGSRARSDSARGVLTFVGAEPARQVMLRAGDTMISLSGMATTGLSRLVGTEVVVHGVRISPRDIVISDYVVRSNAGVPAYDGIVEADGTLRLTDGSGARRVPLPAAMRDMIGTRVWVAVKNGAATSYGLVPRR
jgi:hypothetical protein